MIDKAQNVIVLESKSFSPDLIVESLRSRPYSNLALSKHITVPLQVCGLDRILDEQNVIQTEEFIAFTAIRQVRVENKKLIKTEIERIKVDEPAVAVEYKDQLEYIAYENIAQRLPVKTEYIDIIIDLKLNRVYAMGSTNLILSLIVPIGTLIEAENFYFNPLFKRLENMEETCRAFAFWLANRSLEEKGKVSFRGFKNIGSTETIKTIKGKDLKAMNEISVGVTIPVKDEVTEVFRFKFGKTPVIKDYALGSWVTKSMNDIQATDHYANFLRDNVQKIESLIQEFEKDTEELSLPDFMVSIAEEIKHVG
jgi:hypothetical protein